MPESNGERQVMVRDWFSVPAVPSETLKQVFGSRAVDPRVELVALVFEYWINAGATSRLTLHEILKILPGRIDPHNIHDLVSLLSKRGFAEAFFDLTRTDIDTDGSFRAFLLSNGVSIDTIRYYASWNGISPKLFLDGFLYEVLESLSAVVIDLVQLIRFAAEMQRAQLRTILLLATDVDAGVRSLREQVAVVAQVFDALLKQLDPTRLPEKIVQVWKGWKEEFSTHLENLDPFSAGRLLGRIGGDLFQLLTGLLGLLKLLRVAGRHLIRYVPLLMGSVRRVAAEAHVVFAELVVLVRAIGKATIDGVAKVGLGILRTLFPTEVLRRLIKEGRAFFNYNGLSLFPVWQPVYAEAFAGGSMGARFGVLVSDEGRPILMAATSEVLPTAPGAATRAEAMEAIDAILDQLDDLFRDPGTRSARLPVKEAEVGAAAQLLLKQRLDTHLRQLVQKVAYETFAELKRTKRRFSGHELGKLIHARIAARVGAEVAAVAPGVTPYAEKTLSTLVKTLAASDPVIASELAQTSKLLGEPIAGVLMRRPEVLDILGIEKKAEARTQEAISRILKEKFNWTSTTTAGDIQSDLIVADTKTRNLINVDWTSSTKSDAFEKTWQKVVDDLGANFDGNWDKLSDAYRRAFKGEIPQDVKDKLVKLTQHAARETVVRKVLLEEILGKLWNVRSHEMIYDGLAKLWNPDFLKGK